MLIKQVKIQNTKPYKHKHQTHGCQKHKNTNT